MELKARHLLGIEPLDAQDIQLILDTAESFEEIGRRAIKTVPTLRGRTVVNLFMEPSTRTRSSFEIAEKRHQKATRLRRQRLRRRSRS